MWVPATLSAFKGTNDRLQTKVIGQDKAVEAVVRAIRRIVQASLMKGNRPIGASFFVGPIVSARLSWLQLVLICSVPRELSSVWICQNTPTDCCFKLIGKFFTPVGYVGYDDNSNTLTVRRNPYLLMRLHRSTSDYSSPSFWMTSFRRMHQGTALTKNTVIRTAGFGYEAGLEEDAESSDLIDYRPEFLNCFNAVIEFFPHLRKKTWWRLLLHADRSKSNLSKKLIWLYLMQLRNSCAMLARPSRYRPPAGHRAAPVTDWLPLR